MKRRVTAPKRSGGAKKPRMYQSVQPRGPIGNIRPVKLVYVQEANLDPGVGTTSIQLYRLNSLYDPDYSGLGHQPMGFDELMGIYYKYVITGCKYEVILTSTNTTATNTTIVGVTPTVVATTSNDVTRYAEMPGSKFAMLEGRGGNVTRARFVGSLDIPAFFGRTKKELMADDTYMGDASNNPDQVLYLHVWAGGYSGQDAAAIATFTRLTFTGYVRDPKFMASS